MTSSWFLRQGALHDILHNGFWKSDHDFLIMFHGNFLSAMHGFRDNEVLLPNGYDVIFSPPPGGAARTFQHGFWKSDHDFLIAFHSNFFFAWFPRLSGFISSRMWRHRDFSARGCCTQFFDYRFWKGDPDFILVLHCNYRSIVHRFRFK